MMKMPRLSLAIALSALLYNSVYADTLIGEGLIGVNYQPNHHPNGNAFNFHDVFYVGTMKGKAVSKALNYI